MLALQEDGVGGLARSDGSEDGLPRGSRDGLPGCGGDGSGRDRRLPESAGIKKGGAGIGGHPENDNKKENVSLSHLPLILNVLAHGLRSVSLKIGHPIKQTTLSSLLPFPHITKNLNFSRPGQPQ